MLIDVFWWSSDVVEQRRATWKRVYNGDLWRTPGERADGTVGPVRSYTFTTSGQPSIGTCTVAPTSGNSQTTLFDLVCLNFMDDDQPLSFTVHYTDLFEEGRVCACVRCLRLVSRAREGVFCASICTTQSISNKDKNVSSHACDNEYTHCKTRRYENISYHITNQH